MGAPLGNRWVNRRQIRGTLYYKRLLSRIGNPEPSSYCGGMGRCRDWTASTLNTMLRCGRYRVKGQSGLQTLAVDLPSISKGAVKIVVVSNQ